MLRLLRTNPRMHRVNPVGLVVQQDGEVFHVVDADGNIVSSWSSKRLADAFVAKKSGQAVAMERKASTPSEQDLVEKTVKALYSTVPMYRKDDPETVSWAFDSDSDAVEQVPGNRFLFSEALGAALNFQTAGAALTPSAFYYHVTGVGSGPDVDVMDDARHTAEAFWTEARLRKHAEVLVAAVRHALGVGRAVMTRGVAERARGY